MAWRRVVCTAGFSENYLKKEFVLPFLQKNQDVLLMTTLCRLSGQQIFFCMWAADLAALNEFGKNV